MAEINNTYNVSHFNFLAQIRLLTARIRSQHYKTWTLLKLITENRVRESGNECTAVIRLRIQHGGQMKRKGNRSVRKCQVVNVGFYWLCPRVQYDTGLNKAWNGAWEENRIGIITCFPNRSVQTADCRPGANCRQVQNVDCRLGTKRRQRIKTIFRLIRDNMSSENIPSVTQSLFRGHLSPTLALLWNIPWLFLHIICL